MGLASVWAGYGQARNERARGQNSIYKEGSSPSQNPKDTYYYSHIQIQRDLFFSNSSERHSH